MPVDRMQLLVVVGGVLIEGASLAFAVPSYNIGALAYGLSFVQFQTSGVILGCANRAVQS
jgi:hypothetical protein